MTRRVDRIRGMSIVAAATTVAAFLAILLFLAAESAPLFRSAGLCFFTANDWAYRNETFGAAAMFYGTLVVSLIALVAAVPLGFATALFLSEICPPRLRLPMKAAVELLAGIPSVVYGLLGVLFLRNWIGDLFEKLQWDAWTGDTLLTAGLLLGVMILPTVTTLADDAFRSVPFRMRDTARGLGLTRAETIGSVVMPQAWPGLAAAVLLALGRAVGETIAVFLVVGRADNRLPERVRSLRTWIHTWIEPGQTITSKLGGAETNIAMGDPLHSGAIAALGLVLLLFVLSVTFAADLIRSRVAREEPQ